MKQEREGEAKNPAPEAEEDEEADVKQEVVIRQFNITQLDKNGNHLLLKECDIMGIAEHKLNVAKMNEWKGRFKEGHWKMTGSTADVTRATRRRG